MWNTKNILDSKYFLYFSGHKSGLAALLKADHPHLIAFHCLAHRLELGFKDAIKKKHLGNCTTEQWHCCLVYTIYSEESFEKQYESLKRNVILPTRVGGTRWLPHVQRSITTFFKGYSSWKVHPTQTQKLRDMQSWLQMDMLLCICWSYRYLLYYKKYTGK